MPRGLVNLPEWIHCIEPLQSTDASIAEPVLIPRPQKWYFSLRADSFTLPMVRSSVFSLVTQAGQWEKDLALCQQPITHEYSFNNDLMTWCSGMMGKGKNQLLGCFFSGKRCLNTCAKCRVFVKHHTKCWQYSNNTGGQILITHRYRRFSALPHGCELVPLAQWSRIWVANSLCKAQGLRWPEEEKEWSSGSSQTITSPRKKEIA